MLALALDVVVVVRAGFFDVGIRVVTFDDEISDGHILTVSDVHQHFICEPEPKGEWHACEISWLRCRPALNRGGVPA